MKRIIVLVLILMLCSAALAITADDILSMLQPNMDWFSAGEAMDVELPDDLTDHEAEIYRIAYANGHYAALHPEHIVGMYVLNIRTKKFHFTDCLNTLLIDSPNRQHSWDTKEQLMEQGYSPCGSCKP